MPGTDRTCHRRREFLPRDKLRSVIERVGAARWACSPGDERPGIQERAHCPVSEVHPHERHPHTLHDRTVASERAISHLEEGRVVIFAGGTGSPFFTTDTTAALRALEIKADVFIKATKVNGIYDKDPMKHDDAQFYKELDYDSVLKMNLGVMDAAAISLCRENSLEVRVINIFEHESLARLLKGEEVGSVLRTRRGV